MIRSVRESAPQEQRKASVISLAGHSATSAISRSRPANMSIPEDEMTKIVTIALAVILTVGMGGWASAYETDFDDLQQFDRSLPAWKFGRGIVNMLGAPMELFSNMTNAAINGAYYGAYDGALQGYVAGSFNGLIAGSFTGAHRMARRFTTGALEVLTFWKPEYGPTMDPLYGTRDRSFNDSDYFNPDPFWYVGPARN